VYVEGEEAVVALFMQMVAQQAELLAAVQQQQATIGRLEDRVRTLEDQLAKNSSNSAKPPCSARRWRSTARACGGPEGWWAGGAG
jgi:transposase